MSYFSDLGLAEPILRALEAKGYTDPSPIQRKSIPSLLEGRDLLGIAQTGTGKTAAFSLPSLHRLAADPKPRQNAGCRMLVLSPTRELAAQIADSVRTYGKGSKFSVTVIVGGLKIGKQVAVKVMSLVGAASIDSEAAFERETHLLTDQVRDLEKIVEDGGRAVFARS